MPPGGQASLGVCDMAACWREYQAGSNSADGSSERLCGQACTPALALLTLGAAKGDAQSSLQAGDGVRHVQVLRKACSEGAMICIAGAQAGALTVFQVIREARLQGTQAQHMRWCETAHQGGQCTARRQSWCGSLSHFLHVSIWRQAVATLVGPCRRKPGGGLEGAQHQHSKFSASTKPVTGPAA